MRLAYLLDRIRSQSLRKRIEASVRSGIGLRQAEWVLEGPEATAGALQSLGERITDRCREEVARTRRPYGIDQLALAIACAEPGSASIASATFGVFRPLEFIAAFVRTVPGMSDARQVRFAAALLSWGDVAQATLYAQP